MVRFASWESYRAATSQESRRGGRILGPASLVAQFLMRSGLTLFKGMAYPDLRRMQIDLETLGLNPADPDAAIIMISIRQATFEDVLVLESTEAELIERFNAIVAKLDPDVIEGHNIFGFDLPYLVERARRAGVALTLGRDGSAPRMLERDQQVRVGPISQNYAAAFIHGRHVVDTYLQIQRFDAQGQFPRYGLKEVVRQLGLERADRVFVDRSTITAPRFHMSVIVDRSTKTRSARATARRSHTTRWTMSATSTCSPVSSCRRSSTKRRSCRSPTSGRP
jgi:DNA polymerase elongation subunit (family B)